MVPLAIIGLARAEGDFEMIPWRDALPKTEQTNQIYWGKKVYEEIDSEILKREYANQLGYVIQ